MSEWMSLHETYELTSTGNFLSDFSQEEPLLYHFNSYVHSMVALEERGCVVVEKGVC